MSFVTSVFDTVIGFVR